MSWVVARPSSTGSGRKPMSTKRTLVGCSMPSPSTPGRSAVSSCILRLSGSPRDKYGDSTIDKVTGGSHQQLEDQLGPSSARIHGGVWTGPTGTNAAPFLGIADEHGPRLAHTEDLSGYIASAEVMYLYGPSAAARCAGHDRVGRDPTRTAHLRLRKGRWTRLIETPGLLTIRLPPGAGVEIARLLVASKFEEGDPRAQVLFGGTLPLRPFAYRLPHGDLLHWLLHCFVETWPPTAPAL